MANDPDYSDEPAIIPEIVEDLEINEVVSRFDPRLIDGNLGKGICGIDGCDLPALARKGGKNGGRCRYHLNNRKTGLLNRRIESSDLKTTRLGDESE